MNKLDAPSRVEQPASQVFARAVAATDWATLPREVRTRARELVLDTVAVIAAGSLHADIRGLASQIAPGDGRATLLLEKRGATLRDALLINAAATTILQRQDGYAHAKGHPASQLVPLLLAISEHHGLAADKFLGALVGGYEVAARVGKALGGVPPWLHDNGNWTLPGLAAAATSLLTEGIADKIAAGIDGAASLGLAFDRFTTAGGATIHHLYPAMATTQTLGVAQGVASGLTPLPGSLERFYGPHFGSDFHPEALCAGVGPRGWTSFEILNGYFKLHPSCAHIHGVNDAVDQLIAEEGLRPDNFTAITVDSFGEALEIDAHDPHNDLAARFSARATVAVAIRDGRLDDPGLVDLDSLAPLMARIDVRHEPAFDKFTPAGRPGRVTVTFTDGRKALREVIYPRGTPEVPATDTERQEKAERLLTRAYGTAGAAEIVAVCDGLGDSASLCDLTRALRRKTT